MSAAVIADLLASWDAGEADGAAVWLPAGFEITYAGPDGWEVRAGLDRLRHADLETCRPVRSFPSYKGQRNYPGWYWSATMGRRVSGSASSPTPASSSATTRSADGSRATAPGSATSASGAGHPRSPEIRHFK
jgi:hypothetical protein